MANRLDVFIIKTYKDKNTGAEKTQYVKIGVAFETKSGDGFSVILDALPVDGKCTLLPPRENGFRGKSGGGGNRYQGNPKPQQQNQDAEPPQDEEPPV